MRGVLIGIGVAVGAYGAWLLLGLGWDNLVATVEWLVGGVLLHDALLGPALVVAGVLGARLLPEAVRGPVVAGLVVLGTVTLTAVPVLGRFGARADNPTLLDRGYGLGWLAFAVVVALGTVAAILLRRRPHARPHAEEA